MMPVKTTMGKKYAIFIYLLFIIVLSIVRVWLAYHNGLYLIADALYDDSGQILLANNMSFDSWLGEYSFVSLIKGLSFPLFLKLSMLCKIPYTCFWGIFILFSSALFTLSISSRISHSYMLGPIYLFLIYNPVGFYTEVSQRVYRNAVVSWALLLLLSGLLGMYNNKEKSIRKFVPWAIITGMAFPFFWHLREDSIWILPLMIVSCLLLFSYVLFIKKTSPTKKTLYALLLIIPWATLFTSNLFIKYNNSIHYQIFLVNDRTTGSFAETMGLLYQIDDPNNSDPDIWISTESMKKALSVSPTFKQLEEPLKTYLFDDVPRGDMWQWAIRYAAFQSGWFQSAELFQEKFSQVTIELRTGFDEGILQKQSGLSLSAQMKILQWSDFPQYIRNGIRDMRNLFTYQYAGIQSDLVLAVGHEDNIVFAENIIQQKLPRTAEEISSNFPLMQTANQISNYIVKAYRFACPILIFLSSCGFFLCMICTVKNMRQKKYFFFDRWIVQTGLLLSLLLFCIMVAIFCSWFHNPSADSFYLSAAYTLIAAFEIMSISELLYIINSFWKKRKSVRGK